MFDTKKSLKESMDVKIIYWDDEPTDYLSDVTMNDLKDLMSDGNVYKIIDVTNGRKKTIYLSESLKESKNIPTIEGDYKADDGNDYYDIALNLETGEIIRIKNASCTAVAEEMACEYFGVPCNGMTYKTIKIFSIGTSPNVDVNKLPKKYQKYFSKLKESKKSTRKSMKEGLNDELLGKSADGEYSLYFMDDRRADHGKDPHFGFGFSMRDTVIYYIRTDDPECEAVVLKWIRDYDIEGVKRIDVEKLIDKSLIDVEKLLNEKKSLKERSYDDEVRLGGVADNVEYYIGLFGENGTLSKVQMQDLYDNLEILWVNNAYNILYNEGVTVLDACGYKKKLPMMN